jgi:phosphoribosylanthranilate isomerase
MKVKLKICGITSLEDALAAVECGADYLGFNFYPKSPRYIAPAKAGQISQRLPDGVVAVGVFVNQARPEDVVEALRMSGAQIAQLHGDEDPQYCQAVGANRVIKALRVRADFALRSVLDYPAAAVLLDAYDQKLYGGTGRTTDWEAAREAAKLTKIFLAGGLSPENLAQSIHAVEPFAVDLNSGVESAPGIKDSAKLRKIAQIMNDLHCPAG